MIAAQFTSVRKNYGMVEALRGIDLSIRQGTLGVTVSLSLREILRAPPTASNDIIAKTPLTLALSPRR